MGHSLASCGVTGSRLCAAISFGKPYFLCNDPVFHRSPMVFVRLDRHSLLQFSKRTTRYASAEDLDFGNMMEKMQVDMPKFDGIPESVKSIDVANVDMNSLSENPTILAAVALAILGVGAAAAVGGGSDNGTSTPADSSSNNGSGKAAPKLTKTEKGPDLSIPYDAAVRSSYEAWCVANEEKFSADGFAYYQELFQAKAVAEAAAKKCARDLDSFKNKGRPEIPTRQIKPKAQEHLYFANEQQ